MLGVRSALRGLLEADHLYLDYVGRDSFYGFLASIRSRGRLAWIQPGISCTPPDSRLATWLVLRLTSVPSG